MAMMPKRVKYRKSQRGRMKGVAERGNYVAFGDYGLQSLEMSWVTAKNIEAGRVAATHYLRREGKVYIRIFPAQAGQRQAAGDPYGQRQRRAGVLGRTRSAGADLLRDRRRQRGSGQAGAVTSGAQDARSLPTCQTRAFRLREDFKVKAKQLREMSQDELQTTLQDLEKRLFELRSQAVTEKLENSKAIINARRDIARIKTVMHQKSA